MSERVQLATGPDGRPVAHKCALDAADRARLAREADLLRAAHHPGVVRLLADEAGSAGRLVLGWCSGRSLATTPVRSVDEVVRLVSSLATTVADLHQLGITHGAIDASHVLLDGRGHPVLCSFSSAVQHPSILDPAHHERTEADAAALGELLAQLLAEALPAPGRRWLAGRHHRQLRQLADLAADGPPDRRPSPRALAAALADLAPPDRTPRLVAAVQGEADRPGRPRADRDDPPPTPTVPPGPPPAETAPDQTATHDPRAVLVELDRLRPVDDPPDPRPATRTPVLVGVAVGVVTVALVGGLALVRPWATAPTAAAPHPGRPAPTTDPDPAPASTTRLVTGRLDHQPAPPPLGDDPTGRPCPPLDGEGPPTLEPIVGHVDVDGDGCREAVVIDGNEVRAGGRRWRVGDAGDSVAVGDWDCDGAASPAVLRPSTGDVHVFSDWAAPGGRLAATVVARGTGGQRLRATPEACPGLLVERADGDTVPLPLPRREGRS